MINRTKSTCFSEFIWKILCKRLRTVQKKLPVATLGAKTLLFCLKNNRRWSRLIDLFDYSSFLARVHVGVGAHVVTTLREHRQDHHEVLICLKKLPSLKVRSNERKKVVCYLVLVLLEWFCLESFFAPGDSRNQVRFWSWIKCWMSNAKWKF